MKKIAVIISDIDDCVGDPCLNNATCVDGVASFSCVCQPGYEGADCGSDINECENVKCENGGTCTDGINMYLCTCVDGYTGQHCETGKGTLWFTLGNIVKS